MAGQYTYDTTGQSYFFILTVLLCVLIPFTYTTLRGGSDSPSRSAPYPCQGWNEKSAQVRRVSKRGSLVSTRTVLLTLGWVACAVLVKVASGIEGVGVAYDPFKILGISPGLSEKDIKRHYRKLSLKFHPDKIRLAENQTMEDANDAFSELTKAYKALTDEEIRRNFELFGHPDGKQEMSQGIALPSWVVEGENRWLTMAVYALILGVALPYLVGRWWYGTRNKTKDGVLNATAATFFLRLEEETTFPQLVDTLAHADELRKAPSVTKARKAIRKAGTDEFARLTSRLRDSADSRLGGWENYSSWPTYAKRSRVLITAYMLRVPINDDALLREQQAIVAIAAGLCTGLASVAMAHNWLSVYISVLRLQQFMIQAVHPTSSPLLQLPNMTDEFVAAAHKAGVTTISEFANGGPSLIEKVMMGAREHQKAKAYEVAKHWPILDCVDAKFQVIGEKQVTPGAIVSFTLRVQMIVPGRPKSPFVMNGKSLPGESDVQAKEQTIDELIGRRRAGQDGERPSPHAHAPQFPKNRKPSWYVFVGDHKLDRIFVAPHKVSDIGEDAVRTIRISFQAPPGPGLYTFQTYVMSDSFVGTDIQKDMRMQVVAPVEGQENDDEEDDISDPEEDTLAGQMALMKGMPVKRIPDGGEEGDDSDSDDESSTDDSDDDSDSTSDSDSD